MFEVKPPAEEDRGAIADLGGLAFNFQPRPEQVVLEGTYCAYEGAKLVAMASAVPFGQWFGGRTLRCAGVAGVAVAPEHRGRGLASRVMAELLRHQSSKGNVLSTLYPASSQLYRKLGYEFGGSQPELTVPIADLPPGRTEAVSDAAGERVNDLMACFSKFAALHNGPVETSDPVRFKDHVLAHEDEGAHQRTVVVDGADGIEGYASYFTTPRGQGGTYRVVCKHLVAGTAGAHCSLLAYFRRFENAAQVLSWRGPPNGGVMGLSLASNAFSMGVSINRWMTRVLDVPGCLEARGYPPVSGQVSFEVEDPLFPENRGPWLLSAEEGCTKVTAGGTGGLAPLPVNAFSALYTGYATPADLVLAGVLDAGDERLGFLTALFAGPAPWMPDFF